MGIYDPLKRFLSLAHERENHIVLTLDQIEMIISRKLPASARNYPAWWSDPSSHPQVKGWSEIGWKAELHSEKGKIDWVTFRKTKRD